MTNGGCMSDDADKTAAFWGADRHPDELRYHWLNHPVTREYLQQRISGDPSVGSLAYWQAKYFPRPLGHALSLGCGFGGFERSLLQINGAEHVTGIDVSGGAIDGARSLAEQGGFADRITYQVFDLNKYSLPAASYDAIFGISAVHHIENLEKIFDQCHQALKPGALLFLDEYIGPTRWQYSDDIKDIINRILAILPPRFRRRFHAPGVLATEAWRPDLLWFETTDPSESIRSADILPELKRKFDIIDFRPYGGAILHILLSGIAGNFLELREEDTALLQLMAFLEETLEQKGIIKSDFAAIVARPKSKELERPALGGSEIG